MSAKGWFCSAQPSSSSPPLPSPPPNISAQTLPSTDLPFTTVFAHTDGKVLPPETNLSVDAPRRQFYGPSCSLRAAALRLAVPTVSPIDRMTGSRDFEEMGIGGGIGQHWEFSGIGGIYRRDGNWRRDGNGEIRARGYEHGLPPGLCLPLTWPFSFRPLTALM